MSTATFSERLAQYAISFALEDLESRARDHLSDAFVNWIGCAVGGARAPAVEAVLSGYQVMGATGEHPILGRPERTGLAEAVVVDCLSSAALAFDDAHFKTGLHPTGPIAAALLGVARMRKLSGVEYLTALHVGMEIQCRVATVFTAEGADAKLGWYATGVAGGIGAAAAAGRALGFDVAQVENAMALAATRTGGNRGTHGSMAAAYVPAAAAESGLVAACLTLGGLTCKPRALDGRTGLLSLIAGSPDFEGAIKTLGQEAWSSDTAFKPYPSGFVTHAPIDACFALLERPNFAVEQMEALEFRVSPTAHALVANRDPRDVLEAQVSLYHWAALTLLFRSAGVDEAREELLADAAVRALQQRMIASIAPELENHQCEALARMRDGRIERVFVAHALGAPHRPMTREQVHAKARNLLRSVSPSRAERLFVLCQNVRELDDVAQILSA